MISIEKLDVVGRTYRHIDRYRQILTVIFKYGFGELLDQIHLEHYIQFGIRKLSRELWYRVDELSSAQRLRMGLEELGPTFVKLGQLLSSRPDLVPFEYIEELSRLQDRVPSFPFEDVREIIKDELGEYPEDIFTSFDEEPIAAASIGQVHRAILDDSTPVAFKIQRPDIHETIETDLEIVMHLASLMERNIEEFDILKPTKIIEEFARGIEREINYLSEASNIERFAAHFTGDSTIVVPRVFRDLSTDRVLTLDYIDGIKVSKTDRLKQEGYDTTEIARRGATLIMKQIFLHGFFHADPHPGNIFVLPDNVICFLDFGLMGRMTRQDREDFTELVFHVVRRDELKVVESVLKLCYFDESPDERELEKDIFGLIDEYMYLPLPDWDVSRLLMQFLGILTRHRLRLKPHQFLMMKALAALDGVGSALDPGFDIISHGTPFIRDVYFQRFSPVRTMTDMIQTGSDYYSLIQKIPGDISDLLKKAREGNLKIVFDHHGLEPMLNTHDRISNRLSFAIVLASLIIGSSLIALSDLPPKWHDIPIIGIGGFIAAGMVGFGLLVSILRGRRL